MCDQRFLSRRFYLQWSYEIQNLINKILWYGQITCRPYSINQCLNTWLRRIVQRVNRIVDTLSQSATINPLLTCMPPFYARWVHKFLTHSNSRGLELMQVRCWFFIFPRQFQHTSYEFCRRLDVLESGCFKPLRGKQSTKHRTYVSI